jgi:hypothetical protein
MGDLVKIVGRLRASTQAFTAPLSGATCLWYAAEVKVNGQLVAERRFQDVFIDDESGSALIHMLAADVRLWEMVEPWCSDPPAPGDERNLATTENMTRFLAAHGVTLRSRRLRDLALLLSGDDGVLYREFVLRQADRVAVVDRAVREPDPTVPPAGFRQPAFRLVLGEPPQGVIVSNEPGVF